MIYKLMLHCSEKYKWRYIVFTVYGKMGYIQIQIIPFLVILIARENI